MALTKDQETLLRQKIAEGATLGQVQDALQKAGAQLTYMELRFILDDLGLAVQEKPAKQPAAEATPPNEDASYDEMPAQATPGVQVSVDPVARPGVMLGGSVTFSDGTTAQWALDSMGRIGLSGAPKGYQPPSADLPEFQNKLREIVESRAGL